LRDFAAIGEPSDVRRSANILSVSTRGKLSLCDRFGAAWLRSRRFLYAAINIGLEFVLGAFDSLAELRTKPKSFQECVDRLEPGFNVQGRDPARTIWSQFLQPPSSARFLDGPLNWSQLFTWNSTGAVQTARKIWRLPACE